MGSIGKGGSIECFFFFFGPGLEFKAYIGRSVWLALCSDFVQVFFVEKIYQNYTYTREVLAVRVLLLNGLG